MPSSNGNGGRQPWDRGPSGGPSPNLEELLKRGQDKFKKAIPGGSGVPGLFVFLVVVILAAIVAFFLALDGVALYAGWRVARRIG